jgi:hypothetical protein
MKQESAARTGYRTAFSSSTRSATRKIALSITVPISSRGRLAGKIKKLAKDHRPDGAV